MWIEPLACYYFYIMENNQYLTNDDINKFVEENGGYESISTKSKKLAEETRKQLSVSMDACAGLYMYALSHALVLFRADCEDGKKSDGSTTRALAMLDEARNIAFNLGLPDDFNNVHTAVMETIISEWHAYSKCRKNKKQYLYMLEHPLTGDIKIGYSKSPYQRMKCIQVNIPTRITNVVLKEGDRKLERDIHRKFKSHWLSGEWYKGAQDIKDYFINLPGKEIQLTPKT